MQDLRVIGVESGALFVATDAGSEFRLPVTLTLQSQVRQANPDHSLREVRVAPREIQSRIRAGRSAEQVASDTGAELDYVRRFEGPVLDERAFVLESARNVPVSVVDAGDSAHSAGRFGEVIESRLDDAEATDRRWSSFKDPEVGWIVRVSYLTAEVEREASWRYEPKKQALAPHAGDAHTLSRQDGTHATLVPRLRAVGSGPAGDAAGSSVPTESGRFDSGAFEIESTVDAADELVPNPFDRGRSAASVAAVNRAPEAPADHNQTADLLEALRRRRGEREAARFGGSDDTADARAAHPSTGSLRVIDVPLDDFDGPETSVTEAPSSPTEPERTTKPLATHPTASRRLTTPADDGDAEARPEPRQKSAQSRGRKGRASMPSWDEIVFGARSDDDPA